MRILVADDDVHFRLLLAEILSGAGHEVFPQPDGRMAWEFLVEYGADMAVLDITMPEMDGIALLKKIRSSPEFRDMPVLLLTIKALVEDQVEGYSSGADDYLAKPFSSDMLVARVRVLERRILSGKRGYYAGTTE